MTARCHADAGGGNVVVENDRLRISFSPAHGNNIVELRWLPLDLDVLWHNPQVTARRTTPLALPHAGRSEFYDTFHGGWLLSLPAGFYPCDYFGAPIGTLGEYCQLEWQVTSTRCVDSDSIVVRFEVNGVRTPFHVVRELTLAGSSVYFMVRTCVTNKGACSLPIACVEHALFGGRFIEGASVFSNATEIEVLDDARPEHAQLARGISAWPFAREMAGGTRDCRNVPMQGSKAEHLVVLQGWKKPRAGLWNPHLCLGFQFEWSTSCLSKAWLWASAIGGNHYPLWGRAHVVGIEPANVLPVPMAGDFESQALPWLASGESLEIELTGRFITSPPAS